MEMALGMKSIADNIIASSDMRIKATSNLIADIRNMLNEFSSDRKKMSDDQKEALGNFMKNLSGEVRELLKEMQRNRKNMGEIQAKNLAAFVKNLDKEVNTTIDNFHKERGEKFEVLKNKLAMEIDGIKTSVKIIINEVDNLMGEYKDDIKKAHNIWQEMAASLAKTGKEGVTTNIEVEESNTRVEENNIEKEKRKKSRMTHKELWNKSKRKLVG